MTSETPEKADQPDEPKRYAAYDNTLLKFVGAVVDSAQKARASDAYKDAKKAGHDLEVREV